MKKYLLLFFVLSAILLGADYVRAAEIASISGAIGKNKKGEPAFIISEGKHRGTYHIIHDIKGIGLYPGANVLAFNALLTDSTIQFEKFDWAGVKDFMLANQDMLPDWELSKNAAIREIPVTMKLPSLYQPPPVPVKGFAQRLIAHAGNEWSGVQIRYYEFNSPSEAAMFAERWSPNKSVKRDMSEHFRRAYDRFGVWVVNADDERKPPEYWTGRFVLEALSRKMLISKDTSVIFSAQNIDPVLFNAERDTVAPGDTVVFIGQGLSPFLFDNFVVVVGDSVNSMLHPISATARELTMQIPYSYLDAGEAIKPIRIEVQIQRYYHSNPLTLYVRRKDK